MITGLDSTHDIVITWDSVVMTLWDLPMKRYPRSVREHKKLKSEPLRFVCLMPKTKRSRSPRQAGNACSRPVLLWTHHVNQNTV